MSDIDEGDRAGDMAYSGKPKRKRQPKRQISVRAEVYTWLKERARRDGVTITSLVEAAVTRGLDGERGPTAEV